MKIVNFNHFDLSKINKLVRTHLGKYELNKGYVFVDDKFKIFGYCTLKEDNGNIKIDWIYAKGGYGTKFLRRIERSLFRKYSKIILNLSIDPTEYKATVMRRINFYIKNDYRVFDIIYRKKHGPLLTMIKNRSLN